MHCYIVKQVNTTCGIISPFVVPYCHSLTYAFTYEHTPLLLLSYEAQESLREGGQRVAQEYEDSQDTE